MFFVKTLAICLLFVSGGLAKPKLDSRLSASVAQSYPGQVVFLGDSITDFWRQAGWQTWAEFYEPVGAINTGVSGHQTINVIQRINEGIIDNLNSRLAVLLIGTNDLAWGGRNEQDTNTDVGTILDLIRVKLPGCRILLLGALPRHEVDIHQKIINYNSMLSQRGSDPDVFYLDMSSSYATGLGQLIPGLFSDGLHLTSEGYVTWARTMNPLFFELLEGGTASSTVATTRNPGQGQVAFLGDSITQSWADDGRPTWDRFYLPLGAINTGVSGDSTRDTIRRIREDGMIDNLNVNLAVLKIGTNDISQGIPATEIVQNTGIILNLIRERNPGVKILLLGILPRAPREWHLLADEINKQTANYAQAEDVWFLNMNDAFSYDWGMVFPELYHGDYLHLNSHGYEKWAETMNPLFFEILQQSQNV